MLNMDDIVKHFYQDWILKMDSRPPVTEILGMILLVLTYLTLAIYIGPAFMRKRQPYKLNNIMLIYNAAQVAFSVYLVQISLREMDEYGFLPKKCYMTDEKYRSTVLSGIWLFFIAKITELLDTLFFVLRKKDNQKSFLHLFHHSIMLGSWTFFSRSPTHFVIFIRTVNSLIHVFMYAYYGLTALGPKYARFRAWKKYLTIIQLIQFVIGIVYCALQQVSECPPPRVLSLLYITIGVFFFVLFSNFYRKNYIKHTSKTSVNIIYDYFGAYTVTENNEKNQ